MSNSDDVDEQYIVNYFVDDSIIAHADSMHPIVACQCNAGRRAGIFGKKLDRCSNALLIAALEGGENFGRASSDPNLIPGGHLSPSSAFT